MDYSIFSCKEELMKVGGLGLGNDTKEALSKHVQWPDNQEMKSTYRRKGTGFISKKPRGPILLLFYFLVNLCIWIKQIIYIINFRNTYYIIWNMLVC